MFKIQINYIGKDDKLYKSLKKKLSDESFSFRQLNKFIKIRLLFDFSHDKIMILNLNNRHLEEKEQILDSVLGTTGSNPVVVLCDDYNLCEKSLDKGSIGIVYGKYNRVDLSQLLDRIVLAKELLYSRSLLLRNKNNFILVEDPNNNEDKRKYVCASDSTKKLLEDAKKLAKTNEHILITGPTGTGKEDLGKFIHNNSSRKEQQYLNINIAATPSGIISSTLFGHVKGSFTGASDTHKGVVQLADRGTLVLDEFGDIPPEAQVQLLRLLENNEIYIMGDEKITKVNVRIIATTKYSYAELQTKIRRDLFHRFLLILTVLPLNERVKDLAFLITEFLNITNDKYNKSCQLSIESKKALLEYNYPGNIRELKAILARVVLKSEKNIISHDEIINNMI